MNTTLSDIRHMNNNNDHFEILRKIQNKSAYTQRELARDLGFSLGKLNYCIKALNQKGLIKIENFNKNKNKITYVKRYLLTKRGINHRVNLTIRFMKKKVEEYNQLKSEINKVK
jgi:EPS-associated MarR family transcriptional regulator